MKLIFFSFIFAISLNASILFQKIENLVGEQVYKTNKNLIELIFKDEKQFYAVNDRLNYLSIFKVLKQNGLLHLKLATAQEIDIEFRLSHAPVKSLKILNNTLKTLGYYYYFTKSMQRKSGTLLWVMSLQTEFIIDPVVLIAEIVKNGGIIFDISRDENNKWIYEIDTRYINIFDSIQIGKNEFIKLLKPLNPYLIKIDTNNVFKINITTSPQDRWYSHVVFFDEYLNVLGVSKSTTPIRTLSLDIPQNTRYIKINDQFTLDNIKRGLSINIE